MPDNDSERLDELINQLGQELKIDPMKELGRLQDIEPSAGFRNAVLARVKEVKEEKPLWTQFFPQLSWPSLAVGSLTLAAAWMIGLKTGLHSVPTPVSIVATEQSLNEFGSSYPVNSIESWLVKTIFVQPEE